MGKIQHDPLDDVLLHKQIVSRLLDSLAQKLQFAAKKLILTSEILCSTKAIYKKART